jgi:mannose-6-phosphate isomerase-like protein (cupin superfamily)
MLTAGEVYENPGTGARLEVLRTPREAAQLEVERVYKPQTGKAGAHLHRDFEQWFTVQDGEMTMTLDGDERAYGPGETVHVSKGVPHVDPWNASNADLRVRGRFDPVPEFVEAYTEVLGQRMREDQVNKQGEFPQLQLFVLLHAYRADSWGVGPPIAMQKPLIPVLAAIGRLRGHRVQA